MARVRKSMEINDNKNNDSKNDGRISDNDVQRKYAYSPDITIDTGILGGKGIKVEGFIATTLQGAIFIGKYNDGNVVAIKTAKTVLSDNGVGYHKKRLLRCAEDIVKEKKLMKYLYASKKNVPPGLLIIYVILFYTSYLNRFSC